MTTLVSFATVVVVLLVAAYLVALTVGTFAASTFATFGQVLP